MPKFAIRTNWLPCEVNHSEKLSAIHIAVLYMYVKFDDVVFFHQKLKIPPLIEGWGDFLFIFVSITMYRGAGTEQFSTLSKIHGAPLDPEESNWKPPP